MQKELPWMAGKREGTARGSAAGSGSGRSKGAAQPPRSQMGGSPSTGKSISSQHSKDGVYIAFFSFGAAVWLAEEVSGAGSFWRHSFLLGYLGGMLLLIGI